ncbi:hypothetical protein N7532_009876 [Penicillium argentinense]|uniref:Cysteine-rich transmembrane CYSTM domain-containing protein n=1 Tax=Penicillium argentinense TaxID=1131581 RepID=A0A9W9ENR6_9EURO|nr:uncharacterized protein N7532_009876 [Penicillium argentinense]KAJ5085105.1 hypothetical protein N7532_009876 [Penicillium argentinense]
MVDYGRAIRRRRQVASCWLVEDSANINLYRSYPPPQQPGYGPPPGQYYPQVQHGQPQYTQPQYAPQQGPPPEQQKSKSGGQGCLGACLATLCCCFVCEEGCECCAECIECCEMC